MNSKKIAILSISFLTIAILALVYFFPWSVLMPSANPGVFLPNKTEDSASSTQALFEKGEVGELLIKNEATGEQELMVNSSLPLAIFSTTGEVVEMKSDKLIIRGSGSNFADGVSREIIGLFSEETSVFDKSNVKHPIGDGESYLMPGSAVMVESSENIRGKAEFFLKTISILD